MTRRMLPALPYIGIPLICSAALIFLGGKADAFIVLRYELCVIFGYLAAICDIKAKRIPNNLVLAMLAAWVVIMVPKLFMDTEKAIALIADSALGFIIAGGMFLLVYFVSRKGVGGGDVKFMAVSGLYLGLYGVLPAMLYGTVLAAMMGFALIIMKKIGRKDTIPLAPFLYIGSLLVIFMS